MPVEVKKRFPNIVIHIDRTKSLRLLLQIKIEYDNIFHIHCNLYTMEYLNSDVNKLKEIVQLLHSEMKFLRTEIKDLKKQLDQHVDEVYTEIDTLTEKLNTDIQTVQTTIDGKLEYVCGLIDESNGR